MEGGVMMAAEYNQQEGAVSGEGPKIMLLEGLAADATLELLRERFETLPQQALALASQQSTAFWLYTSIIVLCFYIFHRLIEVRSEENNIWAVASKERKIEAKIMMEEKEEEKQKDKLERRKLQAKKQLLLQELHPSIAKLERAKISATDKKEARHEADEKGRSDQEKTNHAHKDAGGKRPAEEKKTGGSQNGGGLEKTSSTTKSEKKRAKNRRRRLARKMAGSGTTTTAELNS